MSLQKNNHSPENIIQYSFQEKYKEDNQNTRLFNSSKDITKNLNSRKKTFLSAIFLGCFSGFYSLITLLESVLYSNKTDFNSSEIIFFIASIAIVTYSYKKYVDALGISSQIQKISDIKNMTETLPENFVKTKTTLLNPEHLAKIKEKEYFQKTDSFTLGETKAFVEIQKKKDKKIIPINIYPLSLERENITITLSLKKEDSEEILHEIEFIFLENSLYWENDIYCVTESINTFSESEKNGLDFLYSTELLTRIYPNQQKYLQSKKEISNFFEKRS